jgi:hypothetical protein
MMTPEERLNHIRWNIKYYEDEIEKNQIRLQGYQLLLEEELASKEEVK